MVCVSIQDCAHMAVLQQENQHGLVLFLALKGALLFLLDVRWWLSPLKDGINSSLDSACLLFIKCSDF